MKLSYYLIESPLERGGLLLASTKTESYFALDRELADNFFNFKESMNLDDLDLELKELLIEFGMLIEKNRSEYNTITEEHWSQRFNGSSILNITLATTLGCNLRCGYCFEQNKQSINLSMADEESIFKFVSSQLNDSKDGMQITWFGGEPLLGIKSIERLSKRFLQLSTFRGKSYSADIITNGVLMTHQNAKILKKALLSSVQITIDGVKEIHDKMRPAPNRGSYDDVIKGVMVSKEYFNTTIRINLNHHNVNSIPKLFEDLAKLELFDISFYFAPIFLNDTSLDMSSYLTREEFAKTQLELSQLAVNMGFDVAKVFGVSESNLPCTALDPSHYTIEPKGYLHKCVDFLGDYKNTIGKIKDGEIDSINSNNLWKNYDIFSFTNIAEEDDCGNCKFLPLCYGGCPKNRMNGNDKHKYICTPLRFNLMDMLKLELDVV